MVRYLDFNNRKKYTENLDYISFNDSVTFNNREIDYDEDGRLLLSNEIDSNFLNIKKLNYEHSSNYVQKQVFFDIVELLKRELSALDFKTIFDFKNECGEDIHILRLNILNIKYKNSELALGERISEIEFNVSFIKSKDFKVDIYNTALDVLYNVVKKDLEMFAIFERITSEALQKVINFKSESFNIKDREDLEAHKVSFTFYYI